MIRRLVITMLAISAVAAATAESVMAHSGPFLIINGAAVPAYSVTRPSNPTFPVPDDGIITTFRPGEQLSIELNPVFLTNPPQNPDQAQYVWQFGDGGSAEGKQVTHAYNKEGSYLVDIATKNITGGSDRLSTFLINIVRNPDYQPPIARFQAGDQELKPGATITFNAGESVGEGLTYAWDFGDGQTGQGQQTSHTYTNPQGYSTVVLKVTDKNGFMGYDAMGFFAKGNALAGKLVTGIIGGLVVIVGIAYYFSRRKPAATPS